jgi:hypothetical protein
MDIINEIVFFIEKHYQWVFSGIGVPLILYFFVKNKASSLNKVTQKNIRAGGDVVGRDKH